MSEVILDDQRWFAQTKTLSALREASSVMEANISILKEKLVLPKVILKHVKGKQITD